MSELVGYELEGGAAHIVLRRPEKANALTGAMVEELLAGVERAGDDDDVRAIVVRGEGAAFTAGFDLADPAGFEGGAGEPLRARLDAIRQKAEWMRRLLLAPKPLVVSVHGLCIGIGTYLTLVADFAVAADGASFGLPEERYGSAGATWVYPFLVREVGLKRATEIVMTGRRFTAAEFAALGLVTRVVALDELEPTTVSLCDALASLPRNGIALNRAVKELSLATIGHLDAFAFHPGLHAHAERMTRQPDEFDFMTTAGETSWRDALAERQRRFAGEWWGW